MKARIAALLLLAGFLFACGQGERGTWADVANLPPTADFSVGPAKVNPGEEVQFLSLASDPDGVLASLRWSFGDGATATGETVRHAYAASGSYDVTLTATDAFGAEAAATKAIAVNYPPAVDFTVAPLVGVEPKTGHAIKFTAAATDQDGTVDIYGWEFGDGSTSSEVDSTHVFSLEGTYMVRLTVTDDAGGTATASRDLAVSASRPPVLDFSCVPVSGSVILAAEPVQFASTWTYEDGLVVSWQWDFGDAETSAERNPVHTFSAAGSYLVSFTVIDDADTPFTVVRQVEVAPVP